MSLPPFHEWLKMCYKDWGSIQTKSIRTDNCYSRLEQINWQVFGVFGYTVGAEND